MANDIIVIEYQARIGALEKSLEKIENDLKDIQNASNGAMGGVEKGSKKAGSEVDKTDKKVKSLKDSLIDLGSNLPFAGAVQEITQMGTAILGVGTSATTATAGTTALNTSLGGTSIAATAATATLKALKIAIYAALGGLVVVFGALAAFFTQSEAGGDKLAKILNVLKSVGSALLNVFISLGSAIVDFTEKALDGLGQVYEFVVGKFFTAMTGIANVLETLGFEKASIAVNKFNESLKQAKKDSENAIKEITKLGQEIADLEDKIGAETIDLALANSKLTTQIEVQLKALRNRTNTYQENLAIIDKIGKLEEEKLKNNMQLINDQIALKRKEFIRDSENRAIAGKQFDDFVNGQIKAEKLLNEVTGSVTEDTLKGISDVLLARDDASRQSLLLEQKLTNLKDQELEKEKQRLERVAQKKKEEDAKKLKEHQDYLKRLEDANKAFREMEEKEFQDSIKNLKDYYAEQLNLSKERYLEDKINKQQFESESEQILLESLEAQKTALQDYGKDTTEIEGQILDAKIKLKQKELDEEKKVIEQRKQLLKQLQNEIINITGQALSALIDARHQAETIEIQNEQNAFDKRQESLVKSLEQRRNAGLISEEQYNREKEKLDIQAARKASELKKKQFKADQDAKVKQIALDTAVAVIKTYTSYGGFTPAAVLAIAALVASSAIQVAKIRSTPVPEFEKGGKVDGKLRGPSHKQGGILLEAEGGEWIVDKHNTRKNESALEAMSGGYFDKYVNQNYVVPAMRKAEERERALKRRSANTADNLMKALEMNGFGDMSHLERLTKSNKSVNVANLHTLPSAIGKEFSRAIANKNYMK